MAKNCQNINGHQVVRPPCCSKFMSIATTIRKRVLSSPPPFPASLIDKYLLRPGQNPLRVGGCVLTCHRMETNVNIYGKSSRLDVTAVSQFSHFELIQ